MLRSIDEQIRGVWIRSQKAVTPGKETNLDVFKTPEVTTRPRSNQRKFSFSRIRPTTPRNPLVNPPSPKPFASVNNFTSPEPLHHTKFEHGEASISQASGPEEWKVTVHVLCKAFCGFFECEF
ncbi:hypothetical protein LTR16_011557, partial [Cryomyces antarcticus]